MNDDIEQLLRSLHLSKIAEIFDAEVAKAEKKESSYQDLVATLLRAQWHHRQETALSYRIRRSGMPEQWSLESFPWKRQPGVCLLYTSPSPRDRTRSRMPSSA